MLILGLDTSTQVCSVALLNNGNLVGEYTQNVKKTHSQRLLPLISRLLTDTGIDKKDLDAVAVVVGPGSFTGLRIGIATAKALAHGLKLPAVGVSTMEALAENLSGHHILVCPMLDARQEQVYAALYRPFSAVNNDYNASFKTLMEPAALSIEDLAARLRPYKEQICFPGDARAKYGAFLRDELGDRYAKIPSVLALNRASSVAVCGARKLKDSPDRYTLYNLQPEYIRIPEAERRRQAKITQEE